MRKTYIFFSWTLAIAGACGSESRSGGGGGDSDSGVTLGQDATVTPGPDATTAPGKDATIGGGGSGATICPTLAPMVASCAGRAFSENDCTAIFDQSVARGCKQAYVTAFTNFVSGGGEFECMNFGFGNDLYPVSQDENVLIGLYCPITVADTSCRSISCNFNADCPSGSSCNDATGACFDNDSYCRALPCMFNADCPSGQTCNDALGACIDA